MEIKTGYLYHIKDEFFDELKDKGLMINHENGHSRPAYLAIKDKGILWFIPLSTRVEKYQKIIDSKIKKYGSCETIMIEKIGNTKQAILIQNAFPTLEKYVKSQHIVKGKEVAVIDAVKKKILENFSHVLGLKKSGLNLFFTDIDKIKEIMLSEIN